MFFGLTIEKLLVIALIAAFVVGPERLPRYAEALSTFTKRAREWMSTARTRVKDEMGDDLDGLDWRTLDPRQYDPRRIIREALLDDAPAQPKPQSAPVPTVTSPPPSRAFTPGEVPPFDVEAT
jgi:sec-independent protein translocase protein TatB